MSHNRQNGAWANAWGSQFLKSRDCKISGSGKWEPGAWKMEPETQYPETGVARVVTRAVRARPGGGLGPIY